MKVKELFLKEQNNIPPSIIQLVKEYPVIWKITDDGKLLRTTNSFTLEYYQSDLVHYDEIIVPIANLIDDYHSDFTCSNLKLKSFKNFPEQVEGNVNASRNNFSSFEGITKIITEDLDISKCPNLISLSGIHKHLLQCKNIIISGSITKNNFLGLLNIKKLEEVYTNDDYDYSGNICEIINKHLQSDRDVLECQEELITNGYRHYAKL
jgi:hypothetical protein